LGLIHKQPLHPDQLGKRDLGTDLGVAQIMFSGPGLDKLAPALVIGLVEVRTIQSLGDRVDERIKRPDHGPLLDPGIVPQTPDQLVLDTDVKGAHTDVLDITDLVPPERKEQAEHERSLAIPKDALDDNLQRLIAGGVAKGVEDLSLLVVPGKTFKPCEILETIHRNLTGLERDATTTRTELFHDFFFGDGGHDVR